MPTEHRCPECELVYALGDFAPRDNSQFEAEDPPGIGEPMRQSRCPACNRAYGARRRFVCGSLTDLAGEVGVRIRARKGSVHRVVEVSGRRASDAAVARLVAAIQEFNMALPDEERVRGDFR